MLKGSACVMAVRDFPASAAYYRDALGFELTFQYGEPPYYACFCRDDVQVHVIDAAQSDRKPGAGALCIFVDDADAIHAELLKNGARVEQPPQTHAYGMRDFNVVDLDGNRLTYGAGV